MIGLCERNGVFVCVESIRSDGGIYKLIRAGRTDNSVAIQRSCKLVYKSDLL